MNPYLREVTVATPDAPREVDELAAARARWDAQIAADRRRWDALAAPPPPEGGPVEPRAATAGQQDHANPWIYAGEPAPPPLDVGRPPDPRARAISPGGVAR